MLQCFRPPPCLLAACSARSLTTRHVMQTCSHSNTPARALCCDPKRIRVEANLGKGGAQRYRIRYAAAVLRRRNTQPDPAASDEHGNERTIASGLLHDANPSQCSGGERPMRPSHEPIWLCCLVALSVAGCVPYTVATTAQPVPEGDVATVLVWYSIPNGIEVMRDSGVAWVGIDAESRLGVSDRADVGIRIPSASGLVVTYKYRLSANPDR